MTILGNLRGRRRKVARSYLRSAPRRRPRRKRGAAATRGRGGGGTRRRRRRRGGQCPSPERKEEERGAGEGGREGGASLPERASCWTEGIFVARAGNNMHIEVGHIHNNATRAVELFQGVKPDHGFFSWWQFFWGEFLKPRGHFRLAVGGASEWKCGAEQQTRLPLVWSTGRPASEWPASGRLVVGRRDLSKSTARLQKRRCILQGMWMWGRGPRMPCPQRASKKSAGQQSSVHAA